MDSKSSQFNLVKFLKIVDISTIILLIIAAVYFYNEGSFYWASLALLSAFTTYLFMKIQLGPKLARQLLIRSRTQKE